MVFWLDFGFFLCLVEVENALRGIIAHTKFSGRLSFSSFAACCAFQMIAEFCALDTRPSHSPSVLNPIGCKPRTMVDPFEELHFCCQRKLLPRLD